jgi:hypothetical protein
VPEGPGAVARCAFGSGLPPFLFLVLLGQFLRGHQGVHAGGLLAVIADGDLLPAATSALRSAYGRRVGTGAGSYEQDIVVISPREAKGLEFDGVVVLEPSTMLNHEHGKVGDLYVAMTRATQRLRLIAGQPVPAGIVR